jgi:FKBP-type peptidyl-prolyl cis-trans isomerase FklB
MSLDVREGGEMGSKWIVCVGIVLFAWNVSAQTAAPSKAQQGKVSVPATTAPETQKAPASGATAAKTQKDAGPAATSGALATPKDKTSYTIGVQFAKSIKAQGIDIDSSKTLMGFKDGMSEGKPMLSDDEMKAIMTALQAEVQKRQTEQASKLADENKKAGDAFLAENGKKEGVVTLPSGLQYKILKAGDGKKPTANDTILCNYRGTFINGTEFDSSSGHGNPAGPSTPATFPLGGIIPGMREGLTMMPVGSKWQIFIPPSLAYGQNGAGGVIGPNATLIFEVELVSIKDAAANPANGAPQGGPQAR